MSETVDAVDSIPATPGTPEGVSFWGGKIPAVPPTPAVPGHGKLTVTKKIPMIQPPAAISPPAAAIKLLKNNPNLAGQFEAKYGKGSAKTYLGK
jgi:hypothetical protein